MARRRADAAGWVDAWSRAFDVEKVTKRFYQDYAAVFAAAEELIGKRKELAGDELRMFTQTLFNRLMFLRFMERKGWLRFGKRQDYLLALHAAGRCGKKSFCNGCLKPLFFEGLATENAEESEAYGRVPYLNGGLFERTRLDERVADLPDEVFRPILAGEQEGGLFYRYNFTVEESTPLDIEVAVDPEMLGKVFEELVTGRHESGSYYTPRPVVSIKIFCRKNLKSSPTATNDCDMRVRNQRGPKASEPGGFRPKETFSPPRARSKTSGDEEETRGTGRRSVEERDLKFAIWDLRRRGEVFPHVAPIVPNSRRNLPGQRGQGYWVFPCLATEWRHATSLGRDLVEPYAEGEGPMVKQRPYPRCGLDRSFEKGEGIDPAPLAGVVKTMAS